MLFSWPRRTIAAELLDRSGGGRLLRSVPTWKGLLVFNYHRIGCADESPFDRELWSASPEQFERQVKFLSRNFDVVGVSDLADVLRRRRGRHVMITFDDGYRDNYEFAFPLLRQHGAAATFFISTGFLDRPSVPWWDEIAWMVRTSSLDGLPASEWLGDQRLPFDEPDRSQAIYRLLRIYKQLPAERAPHYVAYLAEATGSGRVGSEVAEDLWMTWEMVREMRAAGMDIGGHTVNHPVLSRLDAESQQAEISGCRQRIAEELGEAPLAFSYPVGGRSAFNGDTRKALEIAGFRWAFSYYGGCARPAHADAFDIPRVAVERNHRPSNLRCIATLPQVFA